MATLTNDELARVRLELGDNILAIGADPYLPVRAIWDVVRDNVVSSSTQPTSSSTAITSAGATTIVVASAAGLSVGTRVQLDVDQQRETCTIRSISGTTLGLIARLQHGGTYPVEIESPLTLVRGILSDLAALEQVHTREGYDALGLRRVDEVEWDERGAQYWIERARVWLRRRLATACGIRLAGRGSALEVY